MALIHHLHDFDDVEIRALAQGGPLVILNVAEFRTDADVICTYGLHVVHLLTAGIHECMGQYAELKELLKILEDVGAPQNRWKRLRRGTPPSPFLVVNHNCTANPNVSS